MNDITESLKRIGFTEYESKIYVALLGSNPVNGNEIANLSGVPGPKVYGCLQSMYEKGYVSIVYEEGVSRPKTKYFATPYGQVLSNYSQSVSRDIRFLKKELKLLQEKKPENLLKQELYQILDYHVTFNTIKELIQSSQKSIYICCWNKHYELIEQDLYDAFKRNVKIVTLLFDSPIKQPSWKHIVHLNTKLVEERHRYELNIVIDEKVVVISKLDENHSFAVVSDNIALVQTTLNYIRHDIYINRVLLDFYEKAINLYGPELQELLNI